MITADTAYAVAAGYRKVFLFLADRPRVDRLDLATDIAQKHPAIEVLDVYCDAIEAMQPMFPASRAQAVDALHRNILIASIWCRP